MRLQEPVEDGNERAIHRDKCKISSGRSPGSILIALIRFSFQSLIYNRSPRQGHVEDSA